MENKEGMSGEIPSQEKPKANKKKRKVPLKSIIQGTILTRERVVNQLPFLFYVVVIAVLYIANSYNSDKVIIECTRIKKANEEYRYAYISTHSKLMNVSRQSELARKLATTGLKELKVPPRKITLKENNKKN
jgi:hypothetical protein